MNRSMLRCKTQPNSIINKFSQNPLPSIHARVQQGTLTSSNLNTLTHTKIPIQDYLSIMKSNPITKWSPEKNITTTNFVLSEFSKLQKETRRDKDLKMRMSQITAKRRQVKYSYQHKDVDLFKKYKLPEIVQSILGCYEYYEQFGYSASKIASIIKYHCRNKKDLQWILLKKIRSELNSFEFTFEFRVDATEILNRTLRAVLSKADHVKAHFLRDVISFKISLEQDLIDKGKGKIKEITDSIDHEKKSLNFRMETISQNCNMSSTKINHKSLSKNDIEMITRTEDYSNNFMESSRVNRHLYRYFNSLLTDD